MSTGKEKETCTTTTTTTTANAVPCCSCSSNQKTLTVEIDDKVPLTGVFPVGEVTYYLCGGVRKQIQIPEGTLVEYHGIKYYLTDGDIFKNSPVTKTKVIVDIPIGTQLQNAKGKQFTLGSNKTFSIKRDWECQVSNIYTLQPVESKEPHLLLPYNNDPVNQFFLVKVIN